MKLEYEVLYTDKIVPICLPDTRDAPIGSLGIVTGWVFISLKLLCLSSVLIR